jgi:hypothetical protein
MSGFRSLPQITEPLVPAGLMSVSPDSFAFTWKTRPKDPVFVGLRPLAKTDLDFCRSEALRKAVNAHPHQNDQTNRMDSFNDWLMALAVVRGTCDPNDARKGWEMWFGAGEDNVSSMLTREGVKALYDAVERVTIQCSPVRAQITDEEFDELSTIALMTLDRMPAPRSARVRRLLAFVLEECRIYRTEAEAAE